jgi:hypothetical protein
VLSRVGHNHRHHTGDEREARMNRMLGWGLLCGVQNDARVENKCWKTEVQ